MPANYLEKATHGIALDAEATAVEGESHNKIQRTPRGTDLFALEGLAHAGPGGACLNGPTPAGSKSNVEADSSFAEDDYVFIYNCAPTSSDW